MKEKNPEIDRFLKRAKKWREEMEKLRLDGKGLRE